MAIPNYKRPQDTITQILQQTADREASRRNPLVIGPQFDLFLNDGRDLSASKQDFNSAGATHSYLTESGTALNLTNRTPVTAEAELHGENLEALVATFGSEAWAIDSSNTNWRTIRVAANNIAGAGTLNATLDGRAVKVGDVIECGWDDGNGGTGTTRRLVVGLTGKVTASSLPSNASALGPNNVITLGAETGELIAADTDVVWTFDSVDVDTDLAVFQAHGYNVIDNAGDRHLGDVITVTVGATDGASGTAEVDIVSAATGQSATGVTTVDPGLGEYQVDLTGVGYANSTLTLTHSGTAAAGEVAVVRVFPAITQTATTAWTVAGTYTPTLDRRYAIEVLAVTGGTDVDIKIYDLAGDDPPVSYTNVVGAGAKAVGTSGATASIAAATGLYKGQIFFIDGTAATTSATEFDGVTLDGPAIPSETMDTYPASTIESTKVFQRFTGVLDSTNLAGNIGDALTAGAADWSYAAALGLNREDTGRTTVALSPFANGYGTVLLSYKAIVAPTSTESVIEIDSLTDITDTVGETNMENWLGRGALEAFNGNQNQVVYVLRTADDTVEAFTAALKKIQTTDNVYALAPMTDKLAVMELVKDHCDTQSNPENKNFRRCYVGTDSPGAYEHWGALSGGGYRQGDLASSIVTLDEAFRAESQFTASDVGATIDVQALGLSFTITEVLSTFEVLTDADNGLSALNSNLTITRPDTPENTAEFVIARSNTLNSRRCVNVWSHNPTVTEDDTTKVIPLKFVAAEIAGLRCALLPQQGITLTEILSVDAAPAMYTLFDPSLLDSIADDGVMIVTQESEGGDVFIRHQLTTRTSDGALAYEDNVGVIVDEFSYALKDEFRSYIGARNATDDTIDEIDDKLRAIATDFTQAELVNFDIGPAVLEFFDEKGVAGQVTVRQDGNLADTLLTYTKLRVPLPINGLNHYVDVEVTETLAGGTA